MTATIQGGSGLAPRSAAYQVMLVLLLSLNFGVLFFDRNALNFLMPFVQPDLKLSNTQVGMLASAVPARRAARLDVLAAVAAS